MGCAKAQPFPKLGCISSAVLGRKWGTHPSRPDWPVGPGVREWNVDTAIAMVGIFTNFNVIEKSITLKMADGENPNDLANLLAHGREIRELMEDRITHQEDNVSWMLQLLQTHITQYNQDRANVAPAVEVEIRFSYMKIDVAICFRSEELVEEDEFKGRECTQVESTNDIKGESASRMRKVILGAPRVR
ncbi:hypothetical protein Syun_022145 [Stephania yunnanensis]|uniref:Uncharacterized protein n=1 Tax=Stephania yunnanensis TaxID=152371 RepID=A0AAP0IH32_9MAGN